MLGIGGVNGLGRGVPMAHTRTPAQELEFGTRCLTFFLVPCYLIRLWSVLDPQPGPMTDAATGVSQETFGGYCVVIFVFLYGLVMLLRFLTRAMLRALPPAPATAGILALTIAALLGAALLTGRLVELTGIAVIAAMGVNWVFEAAEPRAPRRQPPAADREETTELPPFPPTARPE